MRSDLQSLAHLLLTLVERQTRDLLPTSAETRGVVESFWAVEGAEFLGIGASAFVIGLLARERADARGVEVDAVLELMREAVDAELTG